MLSTIPRNRSLVYKSNGNKSQFRTTPNWNSCPKTMTSLYWLVHNSLQTYVCRQRISLSIWILSSMNTVHDLWKLFTCLNTYLLDGWVYNKCGKLLRTLHEWSFNNMLERHRAKGLSGSLSLSLLLDTLSEHFLYGPSPVYTM